MCHYLKDYRVYLVQQLLCDPSCEGKMIGLIVVRIMAAGLLSVIAFNVLYSNIQNPPLFMKGSTKTPYEYVANKNTTHNATIGKECQLVQLWLLIRHGTRYPSKAGIRAIKSKLPILLKQLKKNQDIVNKEVKELLDALFVWKPNMPTNLTEAHAKFLHKEGEREMISISQRYVKRFPSLLESQPIDAFIFKSTNEQRTQQSRLKFAMGILGNQDSQDMSAITAISDAAFEPIVSTHDPVLRMYKLCNKWNELVKQNPLSLKEQRLFEKSEAFNITVLQGLSKRLGFSPQYLTLENVDTIYAACTFGQAWEPTKHSPWCSVFTEEMLDMLEYRKDLRYYWEDGYGYNINSAQACVLVKDAVDNFQNAINNAKSAKKGLFYFAHSGTILKLLAYMDLYKETTKEPKLLRQDLKHDNYKIMKNGRKWKTSTIDTFSSNVGLVLMRCNERDYKIGLLHNERFFDIPGCESQTQWCDFKKFVSLFNPNAIDCDFSQVCSSETTVVNGR